LKEIGYREISTYKAEAEDEEEDEELRNWLSAVRYAGINNSGFVVRFYFKFLYLREPNEILFEMTIDGPGLDTDQELDYIGESRSLPPFPEGKRAY